MPVTIQKELHDAVQHVGKVTGDPSAWMKGLSPQDTAVVGFAVAPDAEAAAVLAKIRSNHPTLFEPRTGAPLIPKPPTEVAPTPEEQQGAGAIAIRKAEGDLAHQNSVTAQLDLHVISAILNAHTENERGSVQLERLQSEIEDAVRTRTDLDTPAGARDFQRYLIGKLREIGAVVQAASLDDTSKATLAGAWTALYEASKTPGTPRDVDPAAGPSITRPPADIEAANPTQASASPPIPLPPYGADLGPDPLLDQLLAADPLNTTAPVPATAPSGQTSAPAVAPPAVAPPGLPAAGGGVPMMAPQPAGAGLPRLDPDGLTLDELLAETEPLAEDDVPEPTAEDEPAEDEPAEDEPADAKTGPEAEPDPAPESTEVRLPNGDLVNAPTPQLAKIITTALGGTPIGEAFHQHGLTIAPPGTAVPDPVDPAKVTTGDVGMFTDRQALALDRTRALLGGQIEPLTSVSGPSFLGWFHPPEAGSTAPTSASPEASETPDSPPPTHPATTAAIGN
jgi:Domain of unknown function (DUF4226)